MEWPIRCIRASAISPRYKKIAQTIAIQTKQYGLNSIAGGGDTVAALNQFNLSDHLSYLSAAGGAFLEWLEGKKLPGIEVLLLKK